MSRIIKLLDNETIEIVEYSKANACFQTNKYPNDELFCVIRETFNPFDLFNNNKIKDKEIDRLNNIINELEKYFAKPNKFIERPERMKILDKLKELKEGNKC